MEGGSRGPHPGGGAVGVRLGSGAAAAAAPWGGWRRSEAEWGGSRPPHPAVSPAPGALRSPERQQAGRQVDEFCLC
jgi:hypothetical protein